MINGPSAGIRSSGLALVTCLKIAFTNFAKCRDLSDLLASLTLVSIAAWSETSINSNCATPIERISFTRLLAWGGFFKNFARTHSISPLCRRVVMSKERTKARSLEGSFCHSLFCSLIAKTSSRDLPRRKISYSQSCTINRGMRPASLDCFFEFGVGATEFSLQNQATYQAPLNKFAKPLLLLHVHAVLSYVC